MMIAEPDPEPDADPDPDAGAVADPDPDPAALDADPDPAGVGCADAIAAPTTTMIATSRFIRAPSSSPAHERTRSARRHTADPSSPSRHPNSTAAAPARAPRPHAAPALRNHAAFRATYRPRSPRRSRDPRARAIRH